MFQKKHQSNKKSSGSSISISVQSGDRLVKASVRSEQLHWKTCTGEGVSQCMQIAQVSDAKGDKFAIRNSASKNTIVLMSAAEISAALPQLMSIASSGRLQNS